MTTITTENSELLVEKCKNRIISTKIYLNSHSPFFSTLVNNVKIKILPPGEDSHNISTAATDGKQILFSSTFIDQLKDKELVGVLAHEVLHMVLCHVQRFKQLPRPDKGKPEQYYMYLANYAADIVVNGIIDACGDILALPEGKIKDKKLELLSFPEVYDSLLKNPPPNINLVNICFDGKSSGDQKEDNESSGDSNFDEMSQEEKELSSILEQAKMAEEMYGNSTSSLKRHLSLIAPPQPINYKTVLEKYLTSSNSDWNGYDRRFIHQGIYIDDCQNFKLNLNVYVDSSGSINEETLSKFYAMVQQILDLSNWAEINISCKYFDTELYGPFDRLDTEDICGGGGTDFYPILDDINNSSVEGFSNHSTVNIIYTDGYAKIPKPLDVYNPENILWFVIPGGEYCFDINPTSELRMAGWNNVFLFNED